jgi:hypothetical protein
MLKKTIITLLFILSISSYAQENPNSITLLQFIEELKTQNESIKNAESVNVMVNDVLIENQTEYKIDKKNISRMEILVIDPKKNINNLPPSIIISTRVK